MLALRLTNTISIMYYISKETEGGVAATMAHCTANGNKTTKLNERSLGYEKRMFTVLCMVLIIALLAPNVFAATPAPEVPLADEATVTRVKNEIATGQITDMEDLFLVAYQHLGADISEEGMTAYINEDGTLGFTQIISSEKKLTRSGESVEKTIAVTSMALIDYSGEPITSYNSVFDELAYSVSGQLTEVMVYATHTAYLGTVTYTDDGGYKWQDKKVLRMVTNISYGTNAITASRLEHYYEYQDLYATLVDDSDSETIYAPAAGRHTFYPDSDWERGTTATSRLLTTATVYIENSSQTIYLEHIFLLNSLFYEE